MKLHEYVKVCNYDYIGISVYYTDSDYSNEGTFLRGYCLEHYGDYDVIEINHTTKIKSIKTGGNEFIDSLVVRPRVWIKKV